MNDVIVDTKGEHASLLAGVLGTQVTIHRVDSGALLFPAYIAGKALGRSRGGGKVPMI